MSSTSAEWYEIVGGIIAIPIAIIGAAYTISLIKKTKLESKKLELELTKIDKETMSLTESVTKPFRNGVDSIIVANSFKFVVLKFIILFVLLKASVLVEKAIEFIVGGTYLGLTKLEIFDSDNGWLMGIFFVVTKIPEILYWVIFAIFGWSIFKDANKMLNFELKDFFSWRKNKIQQSHNKRLHEDTPPVGSADE